MIKDQWDKLVIENGAEFLQSYGWGEFQKALGRRVKRIKTDNFLASIIFNSLPFGLNYGYVPRGPVVIGSFKEDDFWLQLRTDSKTIFLEIESSVPVNFNSNPTIDTRQPLTTSILDISKDVEDLFSSFHKTLRYHIRLSERKGVVVKKEKSWEGFFNISRLTAGRHKLRSWSADYYEKLWQTLEPTGELEVWGAYKDEELISSNMYILFGGRATYLFGASNYKRRSLMAPHLLHWKAIQEFKKRGFLEYDFWGIDKNKWPGVTLFKERFGGDEKAYPGSYFKVKRRGWYSLYNLIKAVK